MYIYFNTNAGQYIYFLILIQVNVYFFDTNTGQCIFLLILIQVMYIFLILIQVNVYFLLTFFIINLVLVLKKYTLTCINDKKINKKYT